jgi:hypothetical protein
LAAPVLAAYIQSDPGLKAIGTQHGDILPGLQAA